ncbi:MAG: alpha/beta hydrolase [Moraxellaceae bacterium]|nr:MAG: alpha/beta hydrolase [Moraxellaceae bacterium]
MLVNICSRVQISLFAIAFAFLLSACGGGPLEIEGPRDSDYTTIGESNTVVFIHGMYSTPKVWQSWVGYFDALGYDTYSPAWPLHGSTIEELNAIHPDEALGALKLEEVIEHYRTFLATLDELPILIGHSMGGIITQVLVQEGLAAGGIAISSAPPFGLISVDPNFLRSNASGLTGNISTPLVMTFKQFQFAFTNGDALRDQETLYETYMVPEGRRIARGTLTTAASIDYKQSRTPLLFVAGNNDHMIPASLNRANFNKYDKTPGITDYVQYPDLNHYGVLSAGWESIADYSIDWIERTR